MKPMLEAKQWPPAPSARVLWKTPPRGSPGANDVLVTREDGDILKKIGNETIPKRVTHLMVGLLIGPGLVSDRLGRMF